MWIYLILYNLWFVVPNYSLIFSVLTDIFYHLVMVANLKFIRTFITSVFYVQLNKLSSGNYKQDRINY